MPLLNQTDQRIQNIKTDPKIKEIADVGCYDTSVLTLILTALANRADNLPPLVGRVKELDSIQAANGMPREVRQQSWYYNMIKKHIESNYKQPGDIPIYAKPEFYPLYLHEVVANFNKGGIMEAGENCNPYGSHWVIPKFCTDATNLFGSSFSYFEPQGALKDWSNKGLIEKVRDNYVLLVAYKRFTPKVEKIGGKTRISFPNPPTHHKVVISGFQPGAFPLLINDVGGGTRQRVNIHTDVAKQIGIANSPNVEVILPQYVSNVIFDYEEYPTNEVFFIQHIDGLRIAIK